MSKDSNYTFVNYELTHFDIFTWNPYANGGTGAYDPLNASDPRNNPGYGYSEENQDRGGAGAPPPPTPKPEEPCKIVCTGVIVNCKCVEKPKDPCEEAKKNDARFKNPIVAKQINDIRNKSTIFEYGAEQNLTAFPPGTNPVFKDIPAHADKIPKTNHVDLFHTWDLKNGYTIGLTHGHPSGNPPSTADIYGMFSAVAQPTLVAAGKTAIDYVKDNYTMTIVTQNETYTINVTDWDLLAKITKENTLNKIKDDYFDLVQDKIDIQKQTGLDSNSENNAKIYGLLKQYSNAVSISKLDIGASESVPLKLDGQGNVTKIPCI